jgi:alpha-tubulin suppressor-like RCC1 family protein
MTTSGGVKCWGRNSYGQLGDGTTTDRTTSVDVIGLSSGVAAVEASGAHTCALTTAGGVKCWGYNYYGQLGDGTTTDRTAPVDVTGLSSGVAAVAAGSGLYTCALITSGGVKCWGSNSAGQLGDGTANQRNTPVDVAGLSSAAAIAAGSGHTCALIMDGGLKCWGSNESGQLGAWTHRSTPTDVTGLSSGVAAVAAGGFHTCALTTSGGVKCWGDNGWGELGNGTTTSSWTPVDVTGLSSGVAAVAAGTAHTCAVTAGGGARCWGWNLYGQLGDGTTTDRAAPVGVSGLYSGVTAVAANHSHTCAVTTSGGVKCWGRNNYGQLGDGTTTDRRTPVNVTGLSSGVAAVATGGSHTCALTTNGGVKCWGFNMFGQLGDGTTTNRATPVDVIGLSSGVAAVAAGGGSTCALTTGGGVKCWGGTPVDVIGLSSGVAAVSAGNSHTCALTTAGGVKCWGYNYYGQLGDGTTTNRTTPVDVSGLNSGVAAVATGGSHTCALTTNGSVKCWGRNTSGSLGLDPGWTPVNVDGFGGDWTPAVLAPIEQPMAGALVSNTVTLRGFAIDRASTTGAGIDMVHIYLDGPFGTGTIIGAATYGLDRPDVAAQYGARFGPSGWELAWDTTALTPGVHRLYLYARRTTDNAWSLMDPHMVIVAGGPTRWLPIVLRQR